MNIPPCNRESIYCENCNSHFTNLRIGLTDIVTTKHFEKDLRDAAERENLINQILECNSENFHELHKFEFSVKGNNIFRAKKDGMHILYSISDNEILFLRAIRNYGEYKRFLTNVKSLF
jgi:mRNA-degrading endonuclease RelE of RelBE toxin-antitoxin system